MRKPQPLPEPLSVPFTLQQARDLGISRKRLLAGDLRRPSRGIRVPPGAVEIATSCRPYLQLQPDAVISHTTAARIYGMPLPQAQSKEPVLHLTRPAGSAAPRRRHVVGHRLTLAPDEVLCPVPGLRVTAPARTWLDLASILRPDDLVAAGDWLISELRRHFGQPRIPLVPLPVLQAYIGQAPRVAGIRKARAALELLRVGVDSPPETYLRLMLSRAGLPPFTPNLPLLDETGYPVAWTDLGCREYRTCVEYEGAHHLTREQQTADHHRDLMVAELGWHQVKVNAADMRQGGPWVAAKVMRGLLLGGWERPEQRDDLRNGRP